MLKILLLCFIVRGAHGANNHDQHCIDGRAGIVHLFEWKWTDVAAECERFLGKMGYCGVQISPPNEHIVISNPSQPWWQRYQPVSYKLSSRSGTEDQFKDMVARCNKANVRIFVDVALNHMVGGGQVGTGFAGSHFDSNSLQFPGVPFGPNDFHSCNPCPQGCSINDWTNHDQIRICRLEGLVDLNQSTDYVRKMIVGFLNSMIQYGVAGFRLDAAKHMYPVDLRYIFDTVQNLNSAYFDQNSRAFVYQEVSDFNESGGVRAQEYIIVGMVTEFRFTQTVQNVMANLGAVDKLYDPGWNMLHSENAVVFVSNHDDQRDGSKVITFKDPRSLKLATSLMMAYPYGSARIMSSYFFNSKDDGPPHNADNTIADVTFDSHGSCVGGWVCEHRWQPIAGMASFRKVVGSSDIRNRWSSGGNQVAFGRGGLGFYAITNTGGPLTVKLATGMPPGNYCNVILGCPTSSGCANSSPVVVNGDGTVQINIQDNNQPIFAIHVGAKAGTVTCI